MEQIGRFKILRRLGSGGFGEVWLGHDDIIDRDVAVKVFNPKEENLLAFATSSDTEGRDILRARFIDEARILGSLEANTFVINVLDFGELDDGSPYYVMPYLPKSLSELLGKDVFDAGAITELPEQERPHALPLSTAVRYLEQILTGLAAAHQKGLVHRDIKPSNLMLTNDDEIRLVDFGIAKAPDGQHSTVSQLGMGSRNYMAPEQRESAKHVDARADIYAVGAVAYRCITGKLPIGRFSDPNVLVPALGQALNDLIVRCLVVEKDNRPVDATVLLAEFRLASSKLGENTGITESTGTWVAGAPGSLRDELKPLKDQIDKLLHDNSSIRDSDMDTLRAMARVADLDDTGLNALIRAAEEEQSATLKPVQNFLALVDEQVSDTNINIDALSRAAEALGWDRSRVETAIEDSRLRLAATNATKSAIAPAQKIQSRSWAPIAVAALALLLMSGGSYWLYQDWQANNLQQELATAAQAQANAEKTMLDQAAWLEAETTNTIASYERFLEREGRTAEHESQALVRIEEILRAQQKSADSERQQALRSALTENTVAGYEKFLASGIGTDEQNQWMKEMIPSLRTMEQEAGDSRVDEQMTRTKSAWSEARQKNTLDAYHRFAKNSGVSDSARQLARTQIAVLEGDPGKLLDAIKSIPAN